LLATARTFCALFVSYGFLILANGLFNTLLSLRIKGEGYSTGVVGLLMGGFFLGTFLGALYASRLVRRSGHIRCFAVFVTVMSMAPLLHMFWIEPGFWLVLRLICGFCLAGLFVVTESWLNDQTDNRNRGGIMAIYMVITFLAYGLSQLLLQLADVGGFELFGLCSVFFSLSVLPVLLARTEAPQLEISGKLELGYLLRSAPVGFWGAACAGVICACYFSMAPVFAQELGQTTVEIAYFMAAGVFGGMVLQIPLGRLSDRFERRRVISGVSFASLICCVAMVACVNASVEFTVIVGTVFIFGSLVFAIYPLSAAHANDWCGPDKRMQTSSGVLIGYGLGSILGPTLSSVLMVSFGPAALFVFIGIICLLLMLYSLWQSWKSEVSQGKIDFTPRPCDHANVDTF